MPTFEVETDTDVFDVEAETAEDAQAIVEAQLAGVNQKRDQNSAAVGDVYKGFMAGSPTEETVSRAGNTSFLNGIPIIGPAIENRAAQGQAYIDNISNGEGYDRNFSRQLIQNKVAKTYVPGEAERGQIAGSIIGGLPMGFGSGIIRNAVGNAAVMGGDTAVRGGDAGDVATSAGLGAAFGAAGEGIGRLGAKGLGVAKSYLQPFTAKGARDAAESRVAQELGRDVAEGNALSEATMQGAEDAGNPMILADMGSHNTRSLLREASRVPNNNAVIEETAGRFPTQVDRIKGAWNRMTDAGELNDLDVVGGLEDLAKTSRKPMYDAAYGSPTANDLWSPELQQLTRSDLVRQAMREASSEATNVAAREGFDRVKNPFVEIPTGGGELVMRDGMKPNLPFWDIVQRRLRKMGKAGEESAFGLRSDLNRILDTSVPEFNAARTHAAKIFGAEDLYEAGQKAAANNSSWSDLKRGFSKLTDPERKLFMAGHAKAEYNKIASKEVSGDVSKLYNSPDFNAKIEGMYGPTKAAEFKIQMGIERAMQKTNAAAGGAGMTFGDMARQLALSQGGTVAAGVGTLASGGSPLDAARNALVFGGGRYAFAKIGIKGRTALMKEVMELLASKDPAVRQRLLERAKDSENYRDMVTHIGDVMSRLGRGAGENALAQGDNQ